MKYGMHMGCIQDAHGMAKSRANGGQKGGQNVGQTEDCFGTNLHHKSQRVFVLSGSNLVSSVGRGEAQTWRPGACGRQTRGGGGGGGVDRKMEGMARRDGKRSEGGGAHMDTCQISIKYSARFENTHVA